MRHPSLSWFRSGGVGVALLCGTSLVAAEEPIPAEPPPTAAGTGAAAAQDTVAQASESAGPATCADAYEQAQAEKLALHYKKARELSQVCSQLECNIEAITQECVKLYEQLGSEIPTLVFAAKTWDGKPLFDVKVSVNGELVTQTLDGSAHELDPGTYEFVFEVSGQEPIRATHVARVGDNNRLIEVVFGEAPPAAPAPPPAVQNVAVAPTPLAEPAPTIPLASYILGGTGVAALGVFAYLRFSGIREYNRLNAECSPNCSEREVDSLRSRFKLSYVPLGIGVAALAGAGAVYVLGRGTENEPGAEVSIFPLQEGAGAHLRTRF